MVYCGKPSKACEPCRTRRVKCDLRRPRCSQCRNSGRVCSGYRSDIEVNFRNETNTVVQKYQSKPAAHALQPSRPQLLALKSFQTVGTTPSIAISCFLTQNADTIRAEYLLPLVNQPHSSNLLTTTLEAVSLASLANEQGRPDLLIPARERYALALHHLRRSLRGPGHHPSELPCTFASVMLLAQFAALSAPSPEDESPRGAWWSRHINGAFSMLVTATAQDERSWFPLSNPTHSSLFQHLVACLLVDCIQRRTTFSPQLRANLHACRMVVPEFQLRFWGLVDRMCVLSAAESRSTRDDDTGRGSLRAAEQKGSALPRGLLAWLALEREADVLMCNMPRSQAYQSLAMAETAELELDPHLHVYPSYRVAQTWNTLRMVRLFVGERIIEHAAAATEENDDSWTLMIAQAREVIAMMIHDICASVPEHLRHSVIAESQRRELLSRSGWAYSLAWPLSLAGNSPHCHVGLKGFIARQMKILQSVIGMDITATEAPHEWLHVFFLL